MQPDFTIVTYPNCSIAFLPKPSRTNTQIHPQHFQFPSPIRLPIPIQISPVSLLHETMVARYFLSVITSILLFFTLIYPALSVKHYNSTQASLPVCGRFCHELHSGLSFCSTWIGSFHNPVEECYCLDDNFLHNFVECVASDDYCTTIEDEIESLRSLQENCTRSGRPLPDDPAELKISVAVNNSITKTGFISPLVPTHYTWAFTATKEFVEIIPTVGLCKENTFVITNLGKRQGLGVVTVTSTTTIYMTVTSTEPQLPQPIVTTPKPSLLEAMKDINLTFESMPLISTYPLNSLPSICSTNITTTRTTFLITTYYSSLTYTILTEDTRSAVPTSLYSFWRYKSSAEPSDVNGSSSRIVHVNVLLATIGLWFTICFQPF